MPTRDRPVDRANRSSRAELGRLGSELRVARVSAGLSQREVGALVGLSAAQISRIERALAPNVSVSQLVRIGAVLGLDVRVRAYPGGDAVRDAGQARVLQRLRLRVHPRVPFRLEVPLPIVGDLRAWDAWLGDLIDDDGRRRNLPTEAETRVVDAQATVRRLTLKMRVGGVDAVLVVVADTPMNRRAIAAAWPAIAPQFPVSARKALAALAEGRYPGGSSLIFI